MHDGGGFGAPAFQWQDVGWCGVRAGGGGVGAAGLSEDVVGEARLLEGADGPRHVQPRHGNVHPARGGGGEIERMVTDLYPVCACCGAEDREPAWNTEDGLHEYGRLRERGRLLERTWIAHMSAALDPAALLSPSTLRRIP